MVLGVRNGTGIRVITKKTVSWRKKCRNYEYDIVPKYALKGTNGDGRKKWYRKKCYYIEKNGKLAQKNVTVLGAKSLREWVC